MIYGIVLGLTILVGSLFHQFWLGVGAGLIVDLTIFLWSKYGSVIVAWRAGRRGRTSPSTPGTAPTHGAAPASKGIRWGWIFVLAFIGWCGYSIYYEVGEPGTMLANADYSRIGKPLEIKNLQNQQICNPESQPKAGKWLVDFPDEHYEQAEYSLNRTPYKNKFGFYLEHAAGHLEWLPLTGNAYINNVLVGGKERAVFDGKCFTLTFQVTEEDKRRGVLYGKPICRNDQWCGAASVPTPLLTHLRFYSR